MARPCVVAAELIARERTNDAVAGVLGKGHELGTRVGFVGDGGLGRHQQLVGVRRLEALDVKRVDAQCADGLLHRDRGFGAALGCRATHRPQRVNRDRHHCVSVELAEHARRERRHLAKHRSNNKRRRQRRARRHCRRRRRRRRRGRSR
eukprot:Amastigsp_a128_60.p3 type:complete len:149 gc:universal Amastigsp_a128_60:502-56(-)